jgi:hypothetical protein
LASVTERPPETAEGRPPDWSAVPEKPPLTRRGEINRVLLRAGIAAAIAGILWALGHEQAAVVLLTVGTVATIASLRSPKVAAAIDRGTAAIQRWAGRALSVVLLGAVELLVFIPAALVLRVVRHDPLALGRDPEAPTFWRPTPRRPGHGPGAGLYRRPFGYEYAKREGVGRGRLPLLRVRAVLGLITLLVLADIAIGSAINAFESDPAEQVSNLLVTTDVPAARGEPWVGTLHHELSEVWDRKVYDPFLGWTTPDFAGRDVHVADGVRRSAQTVPVGARDVPEVWFFGGSAMFGLFQRDAHTIPSDVARLAAADGVRVRVVNRGVMAYTNWQEVLLLEQLLTKGRVPDAVVFYDGFNEILGQFRLFPHDEPSQVGADDTAAALRQAEVEEPLGDALHNAWANASAAHRVARATGLARPLGYHRNIVRGVWKGPQNDNAQQRGIYAASIHRRGVELVRRLADSYGFQARFFWQPSVYTKKLRPGEESLPGYLAADPAAWRAATQAARARLALDVHDLGTALDGVRGPVMYDFVHTNEVGARAVARRLYAELRPTLRRLDERERP